MKGFNYFSYLNLRKLILSGGLLMLLMTQACTTYSPARGYSTSGYSYQPQGSAYYPGNGYYNSAYYGNGYYGNSYYGNSYYGNYRPGWFISAGHPGAYYGGWGYAPFAYWPSYSYAQYRHAYLRHAYYPYHDPWYYSYSSPYRNNHYRHPYGYGYGAGYRYGDPWGNYYGSPYGNSYYGNTHSYRPPGQYQPPADNRPDPVVIPPSQPGENQQPIQNRPDPVVIPPSQRGRRGAVDEYNERVGAGLRPRETQNPDRRSVTVVNEEQDLSRSTGLTPGQAGDQGMTISSRNERKVRESRLEPVGAQTIDAQPNRSQNNEQRAYSAQPIQRPAQGIPINSGRSSRAYQSPTETVRTAPAGQERADSRQIAEPVAVQPMRGEQIYRQAPASQAPRREQPLQQPRQQPYQQPAAPRNEPGYQQQLDSSNVEPRADRRRPRDTEREREQENH